MQEDLVQNPNCPRIPFSEEEIRSFYKPWSKALVVKVLEKTFSFLTVKRRIESLWAKSGNIQVCNLANNFFLVRFSEADDYQRAAFGGPWKIYDYYLAVSHWTPSFSEDEPIKKILTWVRLPKLPIHYFNKVAVSRIDDFIGRTVRLDLATSEGARARYARLCVEVDLSKPLLGKYIIEDRVYLVEYESLEDICFGCGFYGHKLGTCTMDQSTPPTEEISTEPGCPVDPPTSEATTGSWMTVQRRQKKKGPKPLPSDNNTKYSGSRFEILQTTNKVDENSNALKGKSLVSEIEQVVSVDHSHHPHAAALQRILQESDVSSFHNTPPVPMVNRSPLGDVTNVMTEKSK
ncbi:hypothetical protein LINPERHAP1_LOCUS28748 [Linum perenne]